MERRYRETGSDVMKQEYEEFMRITPCKVCKGQRLKASSLAVTVGDKNIYEVTDMSIVKLVDYFDTLELNEMQHKIGDQILKEIKSRIGFLNNVGLDYLTLSRATGTLSGGEAQKIAIARALATDPKVLLCDEATSALDPNTTHSILTLIKDINRKLGITVVVITHQMSVVEEICDHVAILDGGVVVEVGEVKEIFSNPKTAAAKRLVAPNGGSAARDLSSFAPDDHVVRVTFNGSSAAKPLVASLAAETGILVSVLSADTRDLSGQCYGSMLLKLPAELAVAQQAVEYMRSQSGVTVEEVTGE